MLRNNRLPKCSADIVAALSDLQGDHFTHVVLSYAKLRHATSL